MYNIGEKIAELRRDRKMTQEELANMIGVSAQSISKWENNVTMPDIVLLPIIADIFEVTIDELFSVKVKYKAKTVPIEETPLAAYDAVLNAMWSWQENHAGIDLGIDHTKSMLSEHPEQHTGFVSRVRGGVYADKDLAVTYIADSDESVELLCDENAAAFLQTIANQDVRKILKYQIENRGVSYTVSSISSKCGISEENAKRALECMINYSLAKKQTVDMGTGERIDIYSHWGDHKLPMLIFPLLHIAESLSDFKENWCGFRS